MSFKNLKGFFGSLFSKNKKDEKAFQPQNSTPKNIVGNSKVKIDIFSPCDGRVIAQKDIPDDGFAENHMGEGLGIEPKGSSVVSFMSGELVVLFKTKHAYIIKDPETGVSAMLHLGIDTVNIPEEKGAFSTNRRQDDILKANDALCEMNLDVIKAEAKSTISALIIQHDSMEDKKIIYHVEAGKEVGRGDLLMSVVSA